MKPLSFRISSPYYILNYFIPAIHVMDPSSFKWHQETSRLLNPNLGYLIFLV